jgi:hypothetical protein
MELLLPHAASMMKSDEKRISLLMRDDMVRYSKW